MSEIPYESVTHYIFDREYNDFSNINTIKRIGAFFVVRAKNNVRIKARTWKRRLPENVISDVISLCGSESISMEVNMGNIKISISSFVVIAEE